MARDGMAETAAEAEAQKFTLPDFSEWREFAILLDGYSIGQELRIDVIQWGHEQEQRYRETGKWDLSVLELRLVLFSVQRTERWASYGDDDSYGQMADSILTEISRLTGLPYTSPGSGQDDS